MSLGNKAAAFSFRASLACMLHFLGAGRCGNGDLCYRSPWSENETSRCGLLRQP